MTTIHLSKCDIFVADFLFYDFSHPVVQFEPWIPTIPTKKVGQKTQYSKFGIFEQKYTIDSIMNLKNRLTGNITKYKTNKVYGLYSPKKSTGLSCIILIHMELRIVEISFFLKLIVKVIN